MSYQVMGHDMVVSSDGLQNDVIATQCVETRLDRIDSDFFEDNPERQSTGEAVYVCDSAGNTSCVVVDEDCGVLKYSCYGDWQLDEGAPSGTPERVFDYMDDDPCRKAASCAVAMLYDAAQRKRDKQIEELTNDLDSFGAVRVGNFVVWQPEPGDSERHIVIRNREDDTTVHTVPCDFNENNVEEPTDGNRKEAVEWALDN